MLFLLLGVIFPPLSDDVVNLHLLSNSQLKLFSTECFLTAMPVSGFYIQELSLGPLARVTFLCVYVYLASIVYKQKAL